MGIGTGQENGRPPVHFPIHKAVEPPFGPGSEGIQISQVQNAEIIHIVHLLLLDRIGNPHRVHVPDIVPVRLFSVIVEKPGIIGLGRNPVLFLIGADFRPLEP